MICNKSRINFSRAGDRRAVRRRGVLLLVVLSLLVLFVLAGLSFIVVASQFKKSSIPGTRVERTGTPPARLINEVITQLLSGPDRSGSALRGHSLLEDLYGRDGFVNEIDSITPVVNGQFQLVELGSIPTETGLGGRVLTMTMGAANGNSTRIVAHDQTNNRIWIESFVGSQPTGGDTFIVNGLAFNGTGAGYNSATQNLDWPAATPNSDPYALLPGFYDYGTEALAGGADESYDAADFQNMALAWMRWDANGGEDIIPSFHRPALLNYMIDQYGTYADIPIDVLRGIVLRPNSIDHPGFSGSNPWLDPQNPGLEDYLVGGTIDSNDDGLPDQPSISTWDIDNDGDGLADSIWIDAGLPTESTADGRQYKPLVAILCLDLDGRININTAGIQDDFGFTGVVSTTGFDAKVAGGAFTASQYWPHGQQFAFPYGAGMGPAEVYLDWFLGSQTAEVIRQRYSPDDLPGEAGRADNINPSWFQVTPAGLLGSPWDLLARGGQLLDHLGQPLTTQFLGNEGIVSMGQDHPYELNVVRPNGRDAIFNESELESLLRPVDIDSSGLPIRLGAFSSILAPFSESRSVTTRSFDIPVPNIQAPPDLRGVITSETPSAFDVFHARLTAGGAAVVADEVARMLPFELQRGERMNLNRRFGDGLDLATNPNFVVDEPGEALPEELISLLNDDPQFLDTGIGIPAGNKIPAAARQLYARHIYSLMMFFRDNRVNLAKTGPPPGNPYGTAKILAQWAINVVDFCDPDSIMTPFEVDLNPFNGWQVDGNPRTTTAPYDTVADPNERTVVWGMERPELVITETLAWHDRRTEDRDDESIDATGMPMAGGETHASNALEDLDQYLRPRGAFFVELFNPWTSEYLAQSPELYSAPGAPPSPIPGQLSGGLNLSRIVSGTGDDGSVRRTSGVWRLMISQSDGDPDDPNKFPISHAERFVYFVLQSDHSSPDFAPNASDKDFYNDIHTTGIHLFPGQYAVVGSGLRVPYPVGLSGPNRYVAAAGFLTSASFAGTPPTTPPAVSDYNVVRRVMLIPKSGSAEVRVLGNGSTGNYATNIPQQLPPGDVLPNVAIVINRAGVTGRPDMLTISEPIGGYQPPGNLVNEVRYGPARELFFDKVLDQPLDIGTDGMDRFQKGSNEIVANNRGLDAGDEEGVIESYRVVYVQRLANPLLPWNPLPVHPEYSPQFPVNPYRTLDSAYVDLAVFNGLGEAITSNPNVPFYAKQRGDANATTGPQRVLWQREPHATQYIATNAGGAPADPPVGDHHFDSLLRTSMGHLNSEYQPAFGASAPDTIYVGAPDTISDQTTFPWFTWNNRPFASPFELLMVPSTSASLLTRTYKINPAVPPNTLTQKSYGHLLPLLASKRTAGETVDPGLHRIFELIEVPSQFAGTRTWYNDSDLTNGYDNEPAITPAGFHTYFNSLSRFRDPGRINLNTISDLRVWQALSRGIGLPKDDPAYIGIPLHLERVWKEGIDISRRGYAASFYDNLNLDASIPTQFANPFRSSFIGDMAPLPSLEVREGLGREATLMRLHPASSKDALLDLSTNPDFSKPYFSATRDAAFRYQSLQKVAANTTNHSNVYAVWVTLGYFEATTDLAAPQGFRLGQELGADTGEIERHHGFYIIDRSIPVGYEPGKKHNADDTIVLQRFIE